VRGEFAVDRHVCRFNLDTHIHSFTAGHWPTYSFTVESVGPISSQEIKINDTLAYFLPYFYKVGSREPNCEVLCPFKFVKIVPDFKET
jgi:hypothetical protein